MCNEANVRIPRMVFLSVGMTKIQGGFDMQGRGAAPKFGAAAHAVRPHPKHFRLDIKKKFVG